MPKYTVRTTVTYPVSAVNAEDALSTVPRVVRLNFIGGIANGLTEILDESTGKVVLTAKLNPEPPKKR